MGTVGGTGTVMMSLCLVFCLFLSFCPITCCFGNALQGKSNSKDLNYKYFVSQNLTIRVLTKKTHISVNISSFTGAKLSNSELEQVSGMSLEMLL